MTRAPRSPGSSLKPFVYGLALEDGLILPETIIQDTPSNFDGYRPTNFDTGFEGDVSVRHALQTSLNIPAVKLLEAVSVPRMTERFKRAGVTLKTNSGATPGLSMVLGGASITLNDLVQLYVNLLNQGATPIAIGDGVQTQPGRLHGRKMLNAVAAWHVTDMLSAIREPAGSKPAKIAYKTGTSYGYRDAWSIGYDGRYVIGVWIGRPDNGSVPGLSGIKSAAPVLFKSFEMAGLEAVAFPKAPSGATRIAADQLPPTLQRFTNETIQTRFSQVAASNLLDVVFPKTGSELELIPAGNGAHHPVVIKLNGGKPPFNLLANGKPVSKPSRRRQLLWYPETQGFAKLTVLDGLGQAQAISIRLR